MKVITISTDPEPGQIWQGEVHTEMPLTPGEQVILEDPRNGRIIRLVVECYNETGAQLRVLEVCPDQAVES